MICDAVMISDASSEVPMRSDSIEKFIYEQYISDFAGQVDQLEDRYLGMVEAASSNLALSTTSWPRVRISPCPPLLSSSDIVVIVRVMCSRWNAKTITKGIVSFADVLHDIVRFYLLYSWRVSLLAISKVRESGMVKGFPVFCRTSAGSKSKIGKVYHGRARSGTLVHGIWINGGRGPCGSRIRARPCRRACLWTRSRRR